MFNLISIDPHLRSLMKRLTNAHYKRIKSFMELSRILLNF
jgi:hypothetical protein